MTAPTLDERLYTKAELDAAVDAESSRVMQETQAIDERLEIVNLIEVAAERAADVAERQPDCEATAVALTLDLLASFARSCVEVGGFRVRLHETFDPQPCLSRERRATGFVVTLERPRGESK